MKTFFRILLLPFVWFWKILSSGLSVLVNLLFLISLLSFLSILLYKPEIHVPEQAVLVIKLEGDVVEKRTPVDPFSEALAALTDVPSNKEIFLQDLLDAITTAADDERILLLSLNSDLLGRVGLDQLQSIGEALDNFRQTGKKIIVQGDNFNQKQYYLAARANAVYLHPMGAVNLQGFSVFRLYVREFLEKLAINVHVFRVGTFKSAVEPLLRDNMSAEDREANSLWLNNLWNDYCADVARNRNIPLDVFKRNIDEFPAQLADNGESRSRLALRTGLVDGLKNHDEVEQLIKEAAAPSSTDTADYPSITLKDYLQTVNPSYSSSEGKEQLIAIIPASGAILYGKGTKEQIGSEPLVKQLRQARQDKRVKAIVLRINTGGGSAFASELIRRELILAKQEGKVVVISMGSVVASGGYWLAAPSDLIVASPVTLTGSIGIFGIVPTMEQTLANAGIHSDGVGTTPIALFGNLVAPMSSEEERLFQLDVERGYRQFLEIIAQGRKISLPQVGKIAEGRVWDGRMALKLGLVDRLGGLKEAVKAAAELSKVPVENACYFNPAQGSFLERLKQARESVYSLLLTQDNEPMALLLRQAQNDPLLEILAARDPAGLYTHSLLPDMSALLQ